MRKDARDVAFKMIYQRLFGGDDELSFNTISEEEKLGDDDKAFYEEIYNTFVKNEDEVVHLVAEKTEGYETDRIFKVDLALLYLAVSEMKFVGTPNAVVINEVVNLSKKYSSDKSQSFINGVLSKVVNG